MGAWLCKTLRVLLVRLISPEGAPERLPFPLQFGMHAEYLLELRSDVRIFPQFHTQCHADFPVFGILFDSIFAAHKKFLLYFLQFMQCPFNERISLTVEFRVMLQFLSYFFF